MDSKSYMLKLIIVDDPYYIHKEKEEDVIKFTPLLPKKVRPFEIDRRRINMDIKRVKERTLEEKIMFCYNVAAMKGDEVECCFEDMLPKNLEKAYNYYVHWEYNLRHGEE